MNWDRINEYTKLSLEEIDLLIAKASNNTAREKTLRTLQILKNIQSTISEDDKNRGIAAFCIYDSLECCISLVKESLEDDEALFSLSELLGSLKEVLVSDCKDNFEGEDKIYAEKYIGIIDEILNSEN